MIETRQSAASLWAPCKEAIPSVKVCSPLMERITSPAALGSVSEGAMPFSPDGDLWAAMSGLRDENDRRVQ